VAAIHAPAASPLLPSPAFNVDRRHRRIGARWGGLARVTPFITRAVMGLKHVLRHLRFHEDGVIKLAPAALASRCPWRKKGSPDTFLRRGFPKVRSEDPNLISACLSMGRLKKRPVAAMVPPRLRSRLFIWRRGVGAWRHARRIHRRAGPQMLFVGKGHIFAQRSEGCSGVGVLRIQGSRVRSISMRWFGKRRS
jgi:hypothetical protein